MRLGDLNIFKRNRPADTTGNDLRRVFDAVAEGRTDEATVGLLTLAAKNAKICDGKPVTCTGFSGRLFRPGEALSLKQPPEQCFAITASGNVYLVDFRDPEAIRIQNMRRTDIGSSRIDIMLGLEERQTKFTPGQQLLYSIGHDPRSARIMKSGIILAIIALDPPVIQDNHFPAMAAQLEGQKLWQALG